MQVITQYYSHRWSTGWTWNKFTSYAKSEVFSSGSYVYQWKMSLQPFKNEQINKTTVLFKLECLPSSFDHCNEIWVKYSVNIDMCQNELRIDDQIKKFDLKNLEAEPVRVYHVCNYCNQKNVEIFIQLEAMFTKRKIIKPEQKADHAILFGTDIASYFDNSKYSDVSFCVGEVELKAHRVILTGRSTVFAAMLENDSLEKKSGRIIISDFDADIVRMFLLYIYSGFIDISTYEMASNLLRMADKYAVEGLRTLCGNYLARAMDVTNCMDILLLSEMHGLPDVKKQAVDFFLCLPKSFTDSTVFEAIKENRPNLLLELITKMAARNPGGSIF